MLLRTTGLLYIFAAEHINAFGIFSKAIDDGLARPNRRTKLAIDRHWKLLVMITPWPKPNRI